MIDYAPNHDPNDPKRILEFHSAHRGDTISASASALIGQQVPLGCLVRMLLYCQLQDPGERVMAVVGPSGVGKTTAVREAASHLGLHLIETRLDESASAEGCLREVVASYQPSPAQTAVLFEGLSAASEEKLAQLASLLRNLRNVEVLHEGYAVPVPLRDFTYVLELGDVESRPDQPEVSIYSNPLPAALIEFLRRYVCFDALSESDLYAVVSTTGSSVVRRAESWLASQGIAAEFTEMAIRTIVRKSHKQFPAQGIRGVRHLIDATAAELVARHLGGQS